MNYSEEYQIKNSRAYSLDSPGKRNAVWLTRNNDQHYHNTTKKRSMSKTRSITSKNGTVRFQSSIKEGNKVEQGSFSSLTALKFYAKR